MTNEEIIAALEFPTIFDPILAHDAVAEHVRRAALDLSARLDAAILPVDADKQPSYAGWPRLRPAQTRESKFLNRFTPP